MALTYAHGSETCRGRHSPPKLEFAAELFPLILYFRGSHPEC